MGWDAMLDGSPGGVTYLHVHIHVNRSILFGCWLKLRVQSFFESIICNQPRNNIAKWYACKQDCGVVALRQSRACTRWPMVTHAGVVISYFWATALESLPLSWPRSRPLKTRETRETHSSNGPWQLHRGRAVDPPARFLGTLQGGHATADSMVIVWQSWQSWMVGQACNSTAARSPLARYRIAKTRQFENHHVAPAGERARVEASPRRRNGVCRHGIPQRLLIGGWGCLIPQHVLCQAASGRTPLVGRQHVIFV